MEHQRGSVDHQLLLAQSGWVQGLAHNLVSDPAGAEDVAQDTMLAALAAPPLTSGDERTLRAWLTRVATNLAQLTHRRTSRRQQREAWAARPEQVCSAAESVERASQLQAVVEAVLGLEEPYRSAVLLRFYDGLSPAQIAERTGCTQVAARKRISRGLERLRTRMDREHDGDRSSWLPAMLVFADGRGAASAPLLAAAAPIKVGALLAAALAALTLTGLSVLARTPRAADAARPTPSTAALEGPRSSAVRRAVAPRPQGRPATASPASLPSLPSRNGESDEWQRVPHTSEPAAEPAQPDTREAFLTPIEGRVVDLHGVGLAGLDLVHAQAPEQVLGSTAWDGSFTFEWSTDRALDLTLGGTAFMALRRPRFDFPRSGVGSGMEPDAGHLLVATHAVHLAGWVSDARGQPVAGATLQVRVPPSTFLDLGLPLDSTLAARLEVQTDAEGAFELVRVPALPSARLETAAAGLATDRRPLPLLGAEALLIRLERPAPPVALSGGLVLLRNGEPAVGAEVHLRGGAEERVTRTDREGRFTLPTGNGPRTLVASLTGWEPGRVTLGSGGASSPVATITLGAKLYSIAGKLANPAGAPLAGWVVSAGPDPSVPGSTGPTGAAAPTTTGPGGGFTLSGLTLGTYSLFAVNPSTLEVAHSLVVQSGSSGVVVQTTGAGPGQAAVGKLVGAGGQPLSGALVSAAVFAPGAEQALVVGPGVLTGPGGEFTLPGARGVYARVLVGGLLAPGAGTNSQAMLITLPPAAQFVFDGSAWGTPPTEVRLLDGQGQRMVLQTPEGPARRAPLFGGQSLVLGSTAAARTLVVLTNGLEVARLPILLTAGAVTTVGPGQGPGTGTVGLSGLGAVGAGSAPGR